MLPNIDDSPSKDLLLAHGLADRALPEEELYDLVFDPNEAANIVAEQPEVAAELRARLERWMEETDDPLLHGPVEPAARLGAQPPGAALAVRPDDDRPMTARAVVIQTQEDAPPGLLASWAERRDIALDVVRVDREERLPDPHEPGVRGRARLGRERRRRRAGVGRAHDRVAARGRRRRAPRARHLLRRAGAGRRARRLRAPQRRSPRSAGSRSSPTTPSTFPSGPWLAWHEDGFTLPPLAYELARNAFGVAGLLPLPPPRGAVPPRGHAARSSTPGRSTTTATSTRAGITRRAARRRPPRATRERAARAAATLFDGFAARAGLVAVASRV